MTLGAWGVYLAFENTATPLDSVRSIALAWRGDVLGIYATGETPAHRAVRWRMEVADESAAIQAKAAAARMSATQTFDGRAPRS